MKQPCDDVAIQPGASAVPCGDSAPWVLAATILGSSMAFIDGTVVNVALPALQSNLNATVVGVQWVVESYGLFLSALILAGGAAGDFFGRRKVFIFGAGVFGAASIACGLSSTVSQLVVARAVQGIGAAALVPGSLAIISASFDEERRGQAIGTWSGFTAITTAFGPVLGGWLIEHASWHWIFFINVPLAAAVIGISLRYIPESRNPDAKAIDWLGALIATLSLAGLIYGFIESATLGWAHPVVLSTLMGGLGLLFLFLFIERRSNAPMVPLPLFHVGEFSGANLLTLLLYAALGIFFFFFPMNMIQVQRYSPTAAGAATLPLILCMFFMSRWSGGLVRRYGPRLPLITGPLIVTAGFVLFAIPGQHGSYWTTFFPPFVVLGLGMAVTVAPLTTVVMSSVERNHAGAASGINNAIARVAGVLAIAIFGTVMVQAFGLHLQRSIRDMNLPANVVTDIKSNVIKLGALDVPHNVDQGTATTIRADITRSFIYGFRLIMAVCAGLALASAAVARLMISSARRKTT